MNEGPITLEKVATNVEQVADKVDLLAVTVTELAEAVHMGFTSVQQELAKKADKVDLDRLENRLGMKIDDLREEVTGFTSDVCDDLSARITVLEKKRA